MGPASHSGRRILLIDDNFVTREMMTLILASEGFRVSTASNGAEALARMRSSEPPDLILLDLSMPVMDGCTFCQEHKEALGSIPIMVISGMSDVAEKAALLGARCYVQKPIDGMELLDKIRHCFPCVATA